MTIVALSLFAPLPLLLPTSDQASSPAEVDFLKDVWPILEERCVQCHGPEKQKGKLRLDLREGIYGGEYPAVVPGDVDGSLLYELIVLPADDPDVMPAKGDPLSAAQVDVLRRWIVEGAAFEEPARAAAEPEPLVLAPLSPEQGMARDAALAKLEERGVHALKVAQGLEALDVNASLLRENAGDAEASLAEGLAPVLVWANFSGTGLTDAGMTSLGRCGELRRLNVSRTAVTDAGLAHLAGLRHLEYLNLYGTTVTDAGLAHLAGLGRLRKLFLWQTAVTDEGVERLTAALPNLVVNRGAELIEPPKAAPVNLLCPVSGEAVDAAVTSEVQGQLVAFCCVNCKAKFDADPAPFLEKIEGLERQAANTTCPVSDQPVDAAVTSEHEGRLVAFCCVNCKAKFDADPKPYLAKLDKK